MSLRPYVIVLSCLILAGCSSKESAPPANSGAPAGTSPAAANSPATSTTAPASTVQSKVDVCGLLTSEDLKNVQGEAYKDAQRSDRQEGDFIVAQCYYALPTTVNSVVLNVTTAREGGNRSEERRVGK